MCNNQQLSCLIAQYADQCFQLLFSVDQQKATESDNKVQKHVTFSENNDESVENNADGPRNFFIMESPTQEQKPNFMVGGDLEETEEKDEFPVQEISRQLSDAALIDKRRRLR